MDRLPSVRCLCASWLCCLLLLPHVAVADELLLDVYSESALLELTQDAQAASQEQISCLIGPSLDVLVGTPVDGVLDRVWVDRGDMVKPGQKLASMQAGVEQADFNYQSARLEFMQRKLERSKDLQKTHLISQQQHDELVTDEQLARLELAQRREQLKLRTITSPIQGVVVERLHNQGDLVQQEQIFRVMQLDPLYVETVWPMAKFGTVQLGEQFSLNTPLHSEPLLATVNNVDKIIDAASSTFRVRLQLPNPQYTIPAGLLCQLSGQGS